MRRLWLPQLVLGLGNELIGGTRQVKIGACVRRVTFASDPGCVADLHRELYESIWGEAADSYSMEQQVLLRKRANQFYTETRAVAELVISRAMPNLEVLVWGDSFAVDRDFLSNVTHSSAQHIKLTRVFIDGPWLMEPPLTPTTWPLRSLELDVSLSGKLADDTTGSDLVHPMSTFFRTLFQLCAPTLESLKWRNMDILSGKVISFGGNLIMFPHLRLLRLQFLRLDGATFLSLLASPLRHLQLCSLTLNNNGSSLASSGHLRDLESFVVTELPSERKPCKHVAKFLAQQKQIQKLYVHERHDALDEQAHLDRYIIPALASGGFDNLRSLSLAWGGGSLEASTRTNETHIPKTALAAIGKIVSLEQLSLGSGIAIGWRNQWFVDHTKLRAQLRGLRRLKTLALVRDTYPIPEPDRDVEGYYSLRFVKAGECANAKARMEHDMDGATHTSLMLKIAELGRFSDVEGEIWERAHRNRMLTHAEAWAEVFSALGWIFCGQLPIGLEQDPENPTAPRRAVPLTKYRDECSTFLNKTFGLGTDNDG
ncbi:hypothetical protein QQZ08_002211 [Neonectria magnoliae]|uniref:Uncharacterized protein n=1 Tax=Neonectria magnoliae TaxID=2732573 RepID=A0ABR1IC94_9HYPO